MLPVLPKHGGGGVGDGVEGGVAGRGVGAVAPEGDLEPDGVGGERAGTERVGGRGELARGVPRCAP